MCSFDIVSLFTNVPLKEVIDICAQALYRNKSISPVPPSLSEKSFRELLEKVTSGVEFSFNGVMYRQTDGVAMGSPLGPILANIFVGYYEAQIPPDKWPIVYDRYVDDVFSEFENKECCDEFFKLLNNLHPKSLQFTRDREKGGKLPFLDALVIRKDDGFMTSLYRKPTFTGLYTPWDSFTATRYKINLIKALVHRVKRICSPQFVDQELNTLKDIFRKNGYPESIIERNITSQPYTRPAFIGPSRCPAFIRLPWLGTRPAMLLEKKIKEAVRTAYFAAKVLFVYTTTRAFRLPKDRLPTQFSSNVIYEFECLECNSRYVGRTSQHLIARVKQHVPRYLLPGAAPKPSKRQNKRNATDAEDHQSAIATHLLQNKACRQRYSDDCFKVISMARNDYHLKVLEAVYIHQQRPPLCKQKRFVTDLKLFSAKSGPDIT